MRYALLARVDQLMTTLVVWSLNPQSQAGRASHCGCVPRSSVEAFLRQRTVCLRGREAPNAHRAVDRHHDRSFRGSSLRRAAVQTRKHRSASA